MMTVIDLFDRGLLIMNTHPEKMDLVIFLMLERKGGREGGSEGGR